MRGSEGLRQIEREKKEENTETRNRRFRDRKKKISVRQIDGKRGNDKERETARIYNMNQKV